jgi:hypothetical protein
MVSKTTKVYPNLWHLATKVHEITSQNTLLFKQCFELQIVRFEVPNLAVQSLQENPDCFIQKSVYIYHKYKVFRTPIFVWLLQLLRHKRYIGLQITCHRNHSVGIGHIIQTQQNLPRFLNRYAGRKLQSRYHLRKGTHQNR